MNTNCPACRIQVPARDTYECYFCVDVVCTRCYIRHNETVHPELYEAVSSGTADAASTKPSA
jgi:hypothetical protein